MTDETPTNGAEGDKETKRLQELLKACATNLSQRAAKGDLPVAYGRDEEVEQILASLASPLRGRIVLTGGPRVGKTAIINEVASRIHEEDCPAALQGAEVWAMSARSILRAFGVNEWQFKLGELMAAWQSQPEIILYLDALPTTLAAGATQDDPFDMAQFLLGQLQSSDSRVLAEGRTSAVQSFFEAYPEYRHVLLDIRITQPPLGDVRDMVVKATSDLEAGQAVEVKPEAIEVALDLTDRWVLHERLPGKTIDLIGEVIALASERDKEPHPTVEASDVIDRFSEKTGLPRLMLTDEEPYKETDVRRYFRSRVLGQEQAVDVVVQALSLLRTRLNNPRRPMGVFLFIGPTGVGKTELARTLSTFLFGSDERIVRFNMADYTLEWHLQVLFGNPHAFDLDSRRGQLTVRLQDHAFAVILLDEFEKAHPLIFQRFLQLFDEGMLINGASETVNLRNSIVIMTSNFGARVLESGQLGFGPVQELEVQEERILEEMVRYFTPEFINRIDSVVFFKPLTKSVLREIAYREIQEVLRREGLARRNLEVEVDEDVVEWVVEHGYSERYGARYLTRQIEKAISYPLARQIIRHAPPDASLLRLFVRNDRVASALVLPTTETEKLELVEAVPSPEAVEGLPARLKLSDIRGGLSNVTGRVEALEQTHNIAQAREQQVDLMQAMSTPSFWDNPDEVHAMLETLSHVSSQVELVDDLRRSLDELNSILKGIDADGDIGKTRELLGEAARRYRYLIRELPRAELTLLFSSPYDTLGAYVHIEAKGQRAEARAWAVQLAKTYLGWAEQHNFLATVLGETLVGKATSGVWLGIGGYGAYGLLKGETGTHRRVQGVKDRDGEARRRMSRAAVLVWPDLPDAELPSLAPGTLRVESRSVTAKGKLSKKLTCQVTASHTPSGYRVTLSSDLPANDLESELARVLHIAVSVDDAAPTPDASHPVWGDVVRSYVTFKRNYVEDARTGVRTGKVRSVLKGDLDMFLEAALRVGEGPESDPEVETAS